VAIASPTAAPEKREERPNRVICRVYARHGDGFNCTLGVKSQTNTAPTPTQLLFAKRRRRRRQQREEV